MFFVNKKLLVISVIITGAVFGFTGGSILVITRDLPQIRSLESFRPSAVTRIYSSDQVLLAEFFVEKRDPVPLETIPFFLKKALVATEDRNFYKHSGVDLKGILRAIIKDILAGGFVEGASTISQQLTKTLFLTPRKTLVRKIREAILAFQLELRFTKNEILELYLNQIYFGSGAYGVESAARIYFGKHVNELDIAECALVAGLPKAPSAYSPLVNRKLALKRRNLVLKQMQQTGIIDLKEYKKILKQPVRLKRQEIEAVKAPYFVEYIKTSLEKSIGSAKLYKGGLTVLTTMEYDLQQAADHAVAHGLFALETRMAQNGIKDPAPQCALVAIDVKTGGILAMTGGKNFGDSAYNRATMAKRQPGSAFKPIVYALAIERGFQQNMLILDAPVSFKGADRGRDWEPKNFTKDFKGEMTLRRALSFSENIPAVRLIEKLGPSSVSDFGYTLGLESVLLPNLSLALGTSEVILLNLTSAYAVFPGKGYRIKPFGVVEIIDHSGRIVWRAKPSKHAAISDTGAAIMTDMLQGVILEGTGKKAQVLNCPVAGKTGTTNKYKDALFIGFSPSVAAGVWVGQDNNLTLGKGETGAKAALPIWIKFMEKAIEKGSDRYFDIPDGVVKVEMDSQTGRRASDTSPYKVAALFKKGSEPGK